MTDPEFDQFLRAFRLQLRAFNAWGREAQRLMAVEEASEFAAAVAQESRGRVNGQEVLDECADAFVASVIGCILAGFGPSNLIDKVRQKLDRLEGRLDDHDKRKACRHVWLPGDPMSDMACRDCGTLRREVRS